PGTVSCGQPRGVGGRMLDVPPAGTADVTVRARADPPPVATGPIQIVVSAAALRTTCPVRHLVGGVSRGCEGVVGHEVAVGHGVLVGFGEFTTANPGGQTRTLLHDEGV